MDDDDFNRMVAETEARAAASPAGLADEIEKSREKYGAPDYAWVDLVEQNLPVILKALRSV